MRIPSVAVRALVLSLLACGGGVASAQSLGSFTWQLQPFCNRLTVTVTQNGSIYTLDGYDDQCGAPQRAPLVGMATPNPDGSIGLGFHVATSPGGKTVSVEARISLATVGGPWTDSAGNSGTLVLNGQAAGSARPAPSNAPSWGTTISTGAGTGGGLIVRKSAIGPGDENASGILVEWGPPVAMPTNEAAIRASSRDTTAILGASDLVGVGGYSATGTAMAGLTVAGTALVAETTAGTTALDLRNGALRVSGARRPAFVHTTSVSNVIGTRTVLDHPFLNARPTAVVTVSRVFDTGAGFIAGGFSVFFDTVAGRWSIVREDGLVMPAGLRFNVIVFNQ